MTNRPWRSWLRFLSNSIVMAAGAQIATVGVWVLYIILAGFAEGNKGLNRFPLVPNWIALVAVVVALTAIGTNAYYFSRGIYDQENPVWQNRRSFQKQLRATWGVRARQNKKKGSNTEKRTAPSAQIVGT